MQESDGKILKRRIFKLLAVLELISINIMYGMDWWAGYLDKSGSGGTYYMFPLLCATLMLCVIICLFEKCRILSIVLCEGITAVILWNESRFMGRSFMQSEFLRQFMTPVYPAVITVTVILMITFVLIFVYSRK